MAPSAATRMSSLDNIIRPCPRSELAAVSYAALYFGRSTLASLSLQQVHDVHACVCVCVRERESVCVCVRSCVRVCARSTHTYTHMLRHMHARARTHTHISRCAHTYTHMLSHISVRVHISACLCIRTRKRTPSTTLPNTTCRPSSHGVSTVVMKN